MKTVIIFAVLLLHLSCGSLQAPEFRSVENVRILKVGTKNSLLALDLHYYNPNKSRLKLKEADGEAWLDGNRLGHFNVDSLVDVQPLSAFSLPVVLQLDMSQIFRHTLTAFLNPEISLKVEGKAKVGKGSIFIRYPLKYEGKINPGELFTQ